MIVSCPGCATHYHHVDEEARRVGRCSQCDETFPLAGPTRRYVVRPAGAMVDPLLAAGLSATATAVDRPGPAPEFPALGADPMAPHIPGIEGEPDEGFFGAGMDDEQALFGMDEDDSPLNETDRGAAAEGEVSKSRPAHPAREALGVFLLGGLGAAAGYQGSMEFGFEPLNAIGAGLVVGITFGWAWIRWAERRR